VLTRSLAQKWPQFTHSSTRRAISINGSPITPSIQLSNPPGKWQYFGTTWNSGASSSATIELRIETIEQGGNDPALDDLSFEVASQHIIGFSSKVAAAPAGLIGWWPGDGNTSDLSGDDDGVPTNIGFSSGHVGPAFQFLGTNSFVRVPNQPAFNAITNITLGCWFWNDPIRPFRRLLTLTPDWVRLDLDESAQPSFSVASAAGGDVFSVQGGNPVTPNSWHHIAGTFDGKTAALYVDGVLVATQTGLHGTDSSGAAPEFYINFLQTGEVGGLIDEAAIYGRALSADEIWAQFAAGSAGMAKAPVFSAIAPSFPGNVRLSIKGQAGKAVTIQSSTDLLDWVTLTTDPNLKGTVNFIDSSAGTVGHRFYRAVSP
ncbi:MAG: LamG domain-containing protein, partial [Verrucomicrobia bacterium]|nr:LamG domain-containing protein [Verrucomicrobiota bacterium]